MKYRLGTVAQFLGVTKNSVRNYEKLGLIHAERDPQNNYRYYRFEDVDDLRKVRSFRNMGFSLEEINELMKLDQMAAVEESLRQKRGQLETEQKRIKEQLQDMEYLQQKIKKLGEDAGTCQVVWRPSFFWLPITRQEGEDGERLQKEIAWAEAMPEAAVSPLFHHEEGKITAAIGFCVEEEAFYRRNLPWREDVKVFARERCVRQVISYRMPKDERYAEEPFESIRAYLRREKRELPREFMGRGLLTVGSGEEKTFYAEIWV